MSRDYPDSLGPYGRGTVLGPGPYCPGKPWAPWFGFCRMDNTVESRVDRPQTSPWAQQGRAAYAGSSANLFHRVLTTMQARPFGVDVLPVRSRSLLIFVAEVFLPFQLRPCCACVTMKPTDPAASLPLPGWLCAYLSRPRQAHPKGTWASPARLPSLTSRPTSLTPLSYSSRAWVWRESSGLKALTLQPSICP